MKDIIQWCNQNQGFLTAIFSLLSVFISAIAIIVSLQTARLPYKKRINISAGNYIAAGETGMHVTVTNVGQCPIKVNMIGFLIDNKQLFNPSTIGNNQVVLHTSESTTHYMSIMELQRAILSSNINITYSIYAFMRDSEEKVYKKYICDVKNILSYT